MDNKLTLIWHTFPIEDLHKKEGTIYVGTDYENNMKTTVVNFREKETGVVYLISKTHKEANV